MVMAVPFIVMLFFVPVRLDELEMAVVGVIPDAVTSI
jgi:hypothetical protein